MAAEERTWTIAVDAVMKATLVSPTIKAMGKAVSRLGAVAKMSMATPNAADAITM